MAHLNSKLSKNNNDKQIEDVIDARIKSGQYVMNRHSDRRPFSAPTYLTNKESLHSLVDDINMMDDGDLFIFPLERIGPTDSEVTVVRVKQKGLQFKNNENKWNLSDDAIPGDGTHLGESPSLVNLVTTIQRSLPCGHENNGCNECLIPLSSWEPSDNPYFYSDQKKGNIQLPKVNFTYWRPSLMSRTQEVKKKCVRRKTDLNCKEDNYM